MTTPTLLVLADDLTGALDTGVQFSKVGVPTIVSTDADALSGGCAATVLVLNLETRHLAPECAGRIVEKAAATAMHSQIPYLYKKTDSAMRGNIGAELDGLLSATGQGPLVFVPAYPATNCTTRQGIHRIAGVPISRSVRDPFNPVADDYVPSIIARQTNRRTKVVTQQDLGGLNLEPSDEILVFDAVCDDEMRQVARAISAAPPKLMAGSAGFAEHLPDLLKLARQAAEIPKMDDGLLVVCGSVNVQALTQVEQVAQHGFTIVELTPQQKLASGIVQSAAELPCILQQEYDRRKKLVIQSASSRENIDSTNRLAHEMGLTSEQARRRIATNIGQLAAALLARIKAGNLTVFGGDTLMAVVQHVGEREIQPLQEIEAGIVHSKFAVGGTWLNLITKSGRFGGNNCILQIYDYIKRGGRHA